MPQGLQTRRESLTTLGAASPLFSKKSTASRSDDLSLGMGRVRSTPAECSPPDRAQAEPGEARPEGKRPNSFLTEDDRRLRTCGAYENRDNWPAAYSIVPRAGSSIEN